MKYYHVDVFTHKKFSGNGLTIFFVDNSTEKELMQLLTQEMRQFESIFFIPTDSDKWTAKIFTTEEELDFAGHPIIGGAAILHDLFSPNLIENTWTLILNKKTVQVHTIKKSDFYSAKMNQGKPEFIYTLKSIETERTLKYFNLTVEDIYENYPCQVITTGLPYLILPIKSSSLQKVKVIIPNLEEKLAEFGAKFFFILDIENRQGRTWDNFGLVEDIATGSAAGPVGAYLVKHNVEKFNEQILLKQGDFLYRPSIIKVLVTNEGELFSDIFVEGDVCKVANGELYLD